jgi:hypothetical protein
VWNIELLILVFPTWVATVSLVILRADRARAARPHVAP